MVTYNKDLYIRQTQRGWIRKQYLIGIKGGSCEKCGYNKCSRCLSFHHRDPKKKSFHLDLRNIGNRKWSRILEEFEKCDLLCMNCHGEHHDAETEKHYISYEMKLRGSQINFCLNCGCEFNVRFYRVKTGGGKYCSFNCFSQTKCLNSKINLITKKELEILLWQKPTTHIAIDFGVSDNTVNKWAKKYNLKKPSRGYWAKYKSKNKETL